MGGDSPIRLIKFPGEPVSAGAPLDHSLTLGAVLGAKEAADMASKMGDVGFGEGVATGLSSGDWTEGDDVSEANPLALPFL